MHDNNNQPLVVDRGSEAFAEFDRIFHDPTTYKISVDLRAGGIAIKQNERMWSPTLSVEDTGITPPSVNTPTPPSDEMQIRIVDPTDENTGTITLVRRDVFDAAVIATHRAIQERVDVDPHPYTSRCDDGTCRWC